MDLYENKQWAVTECGVTSVEPGAPYEYVIPAKRLLEITILRGTMYFWLPQIADKAWADFDAFLDAYKHALDVHVGKYPGTIDPEMMERSIQYARGKIAQR